MVFHLNLIIRLGASRENWKFGNFPSHRWRCRRQRIWQITRVRILFGCVASFSPTRVLSSYTSTSNNNLRRNRINNISEFWAGKKKMFQLSRLVAHVVEAEASNVNETAMWISRPWYLYDEMDRMYLWYVEFNFYAIFVYFISEIAFNILSSIYSLDNQKSFFFHFFDECWSIAGWGADSICVCFFQFNLRCARPAVRLRIYTLWNVVGGGSIGIGDDFKPQIKRVNK